MAGTDASEGQALWQSGGAEEDSRLREGNRHLHLAYDDEEKGVQRLGHSFGEGRAWRRVKMYACTSNCQNILSRYCNGPGVVQRRDRQKKEFHDQSDYR